MEIANQPANYNSKSGGRYKISLGLAALPLECSKDGVDRDCQDTKGEEHLLDTPGHAFDFQPTVTLSVSSAALGLFALLLRLKGMCVMNIAKDIGPQTDQPGHDGDTQGRQHDEQRQSLVSCERWGYLCA
jgi:hypothetical protein